MSVSSPPQWNANSFIGFPPAGAAPVRVFPGPKYAGASTPGASGQNARRPARHHGSEELSMTYAGTIPPHGGTLIDLVLPPDQAAREAEEAANLAKVDVGA